MAAMKWTLEEFDRQPFPLVIELLDHFAIHPPESLLLEGMVGWKPKLRKKAKGYENEAAFAKAGLLPSRENTAPDERGLPDWVRAARQEMRVKKMAAQIEAKKNGK